MRIQKDIKLFDNSEPISVVYTEELFDVTDTPISIYDRYKISILLSDGMNAVVGDTIVKGQKNNILFFRPDEIHFGRVSRSGKHLYMDFFIPLNFFKTFSQTENAIMFLTDKSKERVNYITFDVNHQKLISKIMTEALEILKSDCQNSDLKLFSLIFQIILLCSDFYEEQKQNPLKNQIPNAVTQTMIYISENFDKKLSLKQLSEMTNCSITYLSRIFKQHVGITIYNYIIITRITNAQIMLNKGASVTDACFSSGFDDCSNFIHTFKKITGKTPLQFKNSSNL